MGTSGTADLTKLTAINLREAINNVRTSDCTYHSTYLIQVKLYSDSSGVTDRKQDQYFITPSTVSLSLFFLFVAGPILLNLPLNPGF